MSRGALTFSETAKVMHITFACLLCKISNELETRSFCPCLCALKNTTTRTRLPGFPARVCSGCYLLCSLLSRCNFNNRSQDCSENHSCSWRPKKEENPREWGAPLTPASPKSRVALGCWWQVPLSQWPQRAGGHWSFWWIWFKNKKKFKKSRLVHSGPQTMSAKTKETKSDSCGECTAGSQRRLWFIVPSASPLWGQVPPDLVKMKRTSENATWVLKMCRNFFF